MKFVDLLRDGFRISTINFIFTSTTQQMSSHPKRKRSDSNESKGNLRNKEYISPSFRIEFVTTEKKSKT